MTGTRANAQTMQRVVSKRTAVRAFRWVFAWAVTLGLQWWSLWASVMAVAEGGAQGHCMGRQTSETCVSVWGPWSYAVYAPQGALVVALLAIVISRHRFAYRGTLILAAVSLLAVWAAIAATDGWVIGQMPWFPQ
jgi:hypothetical protein